MELPAEVRVHNQIVGVKGGKATLLRVSAEGYYELNLVMGGNRHRALFPIAETVIIAEEAEEVSGPGLEIER